MCLLHGRSVQFVGAIWRCSNVLMWEAMRVESSRAPRRSLVGYVFGLLAPSRSWITPLAWLKTAGESAAANLVSRSQWVRIDRWLQGSARRACGDDRREVRVWTGYGVLNPRVACETELAWWLYVDRGRSSGRVDDRELSIWAEKRDIGVAMPTSSRAYRLRWQMTEDEFVMSVATLRLQMSACCAQVGGA